MSFPLRRRSRWASGGVLALVVATAGFATVAASPAGQHQSEADHGQHQAFHHVATVTLPAPLVNPTSFDISWVDAATQTYYLADRTNKSIDVINARTDTFEGTIGAGDFTGVGSGNTATAAQLAACGNGGVVGPDGTLTLRVGGQLQLWAGNGVDASHPTSAVKVFDLSGPSTGTLAASVSTGGKCRADEMAYDAADHIVLVANDVDTPPYVSLIEVNRDATKDVVLKKVELPNAIDGIEQPVWDPANDRFYVNIPQVPSTNGDWHAEVAVINPHTMAIEKVFPVTGCSPQGLALDVATQQMVLGCGSDAINGDTVNGVTYRANPAVSIVMDARSGHVVAKYPQVGGSDEVWFDPGTRTYYLAANAMTSNGLSTGYTTPVLGMIYAVGRHTIFRGTFPTTAGDHSVAANPANGQVFVPISGFGVAVFSGR